MPTQSGLSTDDKAKVRSSIPPSGSNILYATLARIYFAYPQPKRWAYGGFQGALAFVKDLKTENFSFKLVDLDGTRGVIWEHELYEGFEYFQDRPFFHSFSGDVSGYLVLF
jgi:neural Wiskott-Aldrich syndrome protein